MQSKLRFDTIATIMRSRYKFLDPTGVHFVTCTIVEWMPVFTTDEFSGVLIDSLQYCRTQKELRLYAYVVMDNHMHFIAEAPDLSAVV